MRTLSVLLLGLALAAGLPAAGAAADPRAKGIELFKTPSGNIGCIWVTGSLRCDIPSGLVPARPDRTAATSTGAPGSR